MSVVEGTLVASTNAGRYAVDDPVYGREITSGSSIEICVGGTRVKGRVEHGLLYSIESPKGIYKGYYCATDDGIVGLCIGMKVRVA